MFYPDELEQIIDDTNAGQSLMITIMEFPETLIETNKGVVIQPPDSNLRHRLVLQKIRYFYNIHRLNR